MKFIIFVNVKLKFIIFEGKRPLVEIDQWPEQTYYNWIFIKLAHLEELQGLQDSLLWSYLFMSLLLLLTHYFLRFALSFSRSRRGLAGLERGNWGWQKPEGRGRSEGVITVRRYWYWYWGGRTVCPSFTKGGGGEDDITAAKGGRRLADCLISQVRGSVVSGTRTLGP